MCGRFSLVTSKEKLQQQLPFVEIEQEVKVSYNIAPTQSSHIITNDDPKGLQYVSWGLIPYWLKDKPSAGKLINARSEGIESKPYFRVPVRKRRCLVPADSFYEWKKVDKMKLPYRIKLKADKLMIFAGVWDVWNYEGILIKTFAIITTEPNYEMSFIHNRMPVLLNKPEQQQKWLAETELEEVLDLLKTPPDDILQIYRVSTLVNKVTNDSPEIHVEIPTTASLF